MQSVVVDSPVHDEITYAVVSVTQKFQEASFGGVACGDCMTKTVATYEEFPLGPYEPLNIYTLNSL